MKKSIEEVYEDYKTKHPKEAIETASCSTKVKETKTVTMKKTASGNTSPKTSKKV